MNTLSNIQAGYSFAELEPDPTPRELDEPHLDPEYFDVEPDKYPENPHETDL